MSDKNDIPTIWEVSDDLWGRIEPILREAWPRKSRRGRHHADWRRCLNGIIYHLRTGCQWNALPREFGDDSTVHRWFQRWCALGVMRRIWADLVRECEDLTGVHWEWQSADGCMGKARHGGDKVGKNPTDRGKKGTKRSVVVDEQGGPLGVVIDGPTATTPSCSKRLLRPSSWAALTQTSTHSTCAWTRAMTTP